MYLKDGCGRHLDSYQVLIDTASNTAVRMPSRPSMRFRPKLAASCANSGPITTPRFGEGGGRDARSRAIQALATSVSSRHASVWNPAGSIAKVTTRTGDGQEVLVDLTLDDYQRLNLTEGANVYIYPKKTRVFVPDYEI